jgi:hypothetical protein
MLHSLVGLLPCQQLCFLHFSNNRLQTVFLFLLAFLLHACIPLSKYPSRQHVPCACRTYRTSRCAVFTVRFFLYARGQGWRTSSLVFPVLDYGQCHEAVCCSGGIAPPFFTLAINGGEWSVSCSSGFTPGA